MPIRVRNRFCVPPSHSYSSERVTELTTNNNIYKFELRNILMRKLQSLVAVPHKGEGVAPKKVFFGQLLVETRTPRLDFAKETANAVLSQAELNRVELGYSPNGDQFVTRKEGNEHVLEFEGDVPGHLKLPESDARSLHVSFREAEEGDKSPVVREKTKLTPSYVITLSVEASKPGEFGDDGFWDQLSTGLFGGLFDPDPERGRAGDPDLKIAIIFGSNEAYSVIPNKL